MFSYPTAEAVQDGLGDKIVTLIGQAVRRTRHDHEEYRNAHPDWAAQSSARGMANWLHDRLWHHLTVLLDDVPDVHISDTGAVRELTVGLNYRIRAKRHLADGSVSSYPTQTALEFLEQPSAALPGMELVHLVIGYTWLEVSHSVGPAVMSLRDGSDQLLWIVEVPEVDDGSAAVSTLAPAAPRPPRPKIEVGPPRDLAGERDS